MTYAGPRTILDADSHVMELGDFLDEFIEPSQRDRLRREGIEALQGVLDGAVARAEERRADPAPEPAGAAPAVEGAAGSTPEPNSPSEARTSVAVRPSTTAP